MREKVAILFIGVCLISVALFGYPPLESFIPRLLSVRRELNLAVDPRTLRDRRFAIKGDPPKAPDSPYNLPPWHVTWCLEPQQNPLPYKVCNHYGTFNRIPLYGGLTNALKMVLLSAILSYEHNRCFFVDEEGADLIRRENSTNQFKSLIERYFAPIGLSKDDPLVQRAMREDRIRTIDMRKDLFDELYPRRIFGKSFSLRSLHLMHQEGHYLKKVMMRRMWRPLPHVRNQTCTILDQRYQLHDDFIGLSIRRGDKESVEHREIATVEQYVDAAEVAIARYFNNTPPKFFVATDDCEAIDELRSLRPQWTFLSECDYMSSSEKGFALTNVTSWTPEQTDAHFNKFFVELYALAISKYFIGWSFTNVAWWVYFMRPDRHSFFLVDKQEKTMRDVDLW